MARPKKLKLDLTEEIKQYWIGVPIATLARRRGMDRQSLWQAFRRRGVLKSQRKDPPKDIPIWPPKEE